jgi:hypothetical protein
MLFKSMQRRKLCIEESVELNGIWILAHVVSVIKNKVRCVRRKRIQPL